MDPLVLVFLIDASLIPPDQSVGSIMVFRNGTAVADCTAAPQAVPDPCVSVRQAVTNGAQITVLTSAASFWTLAVSPLCSNVVCTASDQCHDTGVCNPTTGECSNPVKANGVPCNDGNACTLGDVCDNGNCVGRNFCPTDKNQCKNGGWQSLIKPTGHVFKNQGDCVSFVNTGK